LNLSDTEQRRRAERLVTGPRHGVRVRVPNPTRFSRRGWVAVTGTPGTGKTRSTKELAASVPVVEVSDIALRLGAGRRQLSGSVEVDVEALGRIFRSYARTHPGGILVGHLAHLLPVAYVVVLRCHPRELARRLKRQRSSAARRRENLLAEALDVVLVEALATGRPVSEVDTTDRSPAAVSRRISSLYQRRPPPQFGRVNWLADRWVTEELLPRSL
jgi:adenylate kinase